MGGWIANVEERQGRETPKKSSKQTLGVTAPFDSQSSGKRQEQNACETMAVFLAGRMVRPPRHKVWQFSEHQTQGICIIAPCLTS